MTARPLKVLLVDDSTLIRVRLRRLIANIPRVEIVGEAADGAEGLAYIAATQPDLVILDLQMPGLDGLEMLRRLGTPRPTVAVLTNYATPAYRRRALDLGADYVFDKSTEFNQLCDVVAALPPGTVNGTRGSGDERA